MLDTNPVPSFYVGTKVIEAWPHDREQDGKPGYAVRYRDGYTSWSPKEVFEAAYKPNGQMNFEGALCLLKQGYIVRRRGWNAPHVIALQVPDQYSKMQQPYLYIVPAGCQQPVPWVASQADLMAEDWECPL